MLFNSPLYGVFLIATWATFWLLRRRRFPRALFLVAASYVFYFYGTWDKAREEPVPLPPLGWASLCLAVIFVGSTIDFFVGRALGRTKGRAGRNALLFVSIVYYLGVLAVFKYWDFAADSLASILAAVGAPVHVTHLRIVLPFGISFFTFETMSYTIDVWRGELPPAKRYLDYLLFVCFFPHLVAGPIVRPHQMLPQLALEPVLNADMQARGLWRIAVGLCKKVVIGDFLAQAIVKRVFDTPERFTPVEVLFAVYAYAVYIYVDFSGYSDVAIGSAALFGYELPENFDVPYLAKNLQEFWHRWHISLSTWLRDYLYKPLGGSRKGSLSTYRNLMITMVLGGLWHGASWNFVIWGALHGGALGVTRVWQRARGSDRRPSAIAGALATIATFHFVCLGWVFFRAPTLGHATLMLQRMAKGASDLPGLASSLVRAPALTLHDIAAARVGLEHVTPKVVLVVVAALLLHAVPKDWDARLREAFVRTPAPVQGLVLAAAALVLHLAASASSEPFLYGQF